MLIENMIVLAILVSASWFGYWRYPTQPSKVTTILTYVVGPICFIISALLSLVLLVDTGSTQGSYGAWFMIFAAMTLGVFPVLLLAVFAGAGCLVAKIRK